MIHHTRIFIARNNVANNLISLSNSAVKNNIVAFQELKRFYHYSKVKESTPPKKSIIDYSNNSPIIYYQGIANKHKIMSSCNTKDNFTQDIEEAHQAAINNECNTYLDPKTGYTVFTELAHLKRGICCGNACRHCPYGWQNVPNKSSDAPVAKALSGDKKNIQKLISNMKSNEKLPDNGGKKGGKYTSKNVPYTRKGDSGTSQLLNGEKRTKDDIIFETMGTVDEMNSTIGVIHSLIQERIPEEEELSSNLLDIMSICFDIGSHIAKPNSSSIEKIHIELLENWIDEMTQPLPELTNFILPTGNVISAQCHVARTVCRRAERCVVTLRRQQDVIGDDYAYKYLNRLSDYFFTLGRYLNYVQGCDEITYKRVQRQKQRKRVVVPLKPESCRDE